MYFSGATLQVSLFKDLVTLSDPTNPFSFISYLHATGRIYHFLNAQFESVPRQEFRHYLKWVSDSNENIHFDETVTRVQFDGHFIIETEKRRVTAENIAIGVGSEPYIPAFAQAHIGASQFHVSEFGFKAKSLERKRVVIIGGGQSGAEAFLELISLRREFLPQQVIWISRRDNFSPLDNSSFTNDYFMPCHSDYFFEQSPEFRKLFLERNILASDGISEKTIREIYQRLYVLHFIEDVPDVAALMPGRTVERVGYDGRQWVLSMTHHAANIEEPVYADVVIWATGFHGARMPFLEPIASRLDYDENEIRIDANFAAVWDGPPDRRIFLLNAARRQRGLAEPNLSLVAWRSQRVIEALLSGAGSTRPAQIPSFVTWPPIDPWCERRQRVV